MASGRNNAARKYEDQVPAQREVQPKRHLQVAAAPVKKKKHRRKPAVMQGVYPCIFLVAITAAFILFYHNHPWVAVLGVEVAALAIFMHRSNIVRLLRGQETKTYLKKSQRK